MAASVAAFGAAPAAAQAAAIAAMAKTISIVVERRAPSARARSRIDYRRRIGLKRVT
jgi:hypothetical protein